MLKVVFELELIKNNDIFHFHRNKGLPRKRFELF